MSGAIGQAEELGGGRLGYHCARCGIWTTGGHWRISRSGTYQIERSWSLCDACWYLLVAVIGEEIANGSSGRVATPGERTYRRAQQRARRRRGEANG